MANNNIATIIAGESFDLNEVELNHIVDALQHSGAIIENVEWLSADKAADIYFAVLAEDDARLILSALLEMFEVDFAVQKNSPARRKKLLVSDMDSTIIKQECIDEISVCLGLKDKIAAITERAMNGQIDFNDALRERVALLKGISKEQLEEVYQNQIELTDGAKDLVQTMNKAGAKTVLVSGGFSFFTEKIMDAVGFEEEEANILEFDDSGLLTGKVKEPILDADTKLNALKFHCDYMKIDPYLSCAIGDGANDLKMIKYSGLGVAFCAKEKVKEEAKHHINIPDLRNILYVQGFKDSDIMQ